MRSSSYLVDTDVLSETARTVPNQNVLRWLSSQARVAISAVTIFEIGRGIEATGSAKRRLFLEEWLASLLDGPIDVLAFDAGTARMAVRLEAEARRTGRSIEIRDLFILATALSADVHLATRNTRHFIGRGVLVIDPFAG